MNNQGNNAGAGNQPNADPPPNLQAILAEHGGQLPPQYSFPSDADVTFGDRGRFMHTAYIIKKNGLGVNPNRDGTSNVFVIAGAHSCRFNEQGNIYGQKMLCLTMELMGEEVDRQRAAALAMNNQGTTQKRPADRLQEEKPFKRVMKPEAEHIIQRLNLPIDEITARRMKILWLVWCGFNSSDQSNSILKEVTKTYAKYRIGKLRCKGDELVAGVRAVQDLYKRYEGNNAVGYGSWTFPVLVALNYHLEHFTQIRKIHFSLNPAIDDLLRAHNRANHSEIKWLNEEVDRDYLEESVTPKGVIESDPAMRSILLAYINANQDLNAFNNDAADGVIQMPDYDDCSAEDLQVHGPQVNVAGNFRTVLEDDPRTTFHPPTTAS